MSAARAPGIRRRLVTLVLASAVPAALLAGALLVHDHLRDREQLERDAVATARAMAHAVDRELAGITRAAQVLATSQRIHTSDLAAFRLQALETVALGIGTNVVLSDPSGRQVLNTLRAPGEALPMHGNPAQLRAVLDSAQPVLSNLYTGGVLRRPVISVDVPVLRGGKVVHVLSIGALPERFGAILGNQKLPAGWIGVVFDTAGTIVARTQEHERFVGRKGAPEILARMAVSPEGALDAVTLEGIPVVSAFSRSAATGWTVALGIPQSHLSAQLAERSAIAAGAALALLALGLGLAWRIGGGIARSVRGLIGPADRVGRGVVLELPPLGLAEADEVGKALVRASSMIATAEHRAQHDALTGLANRALFLETAARHVEQCKREGIQVAVLFIDLDGFKRVNDRHGHETGDRLLCAVAARLANAIRSSDLAARLGGDEFAVLLLQSGARVAAGIAEKLVDTLSAPYELDSLTLEISASIGVAAFPEPAGSAEQLLRRADEAMYRAKLAGKQRHALY